MLILGDESQHNGKIPWVTGGLIVANILAFCGQLALGERLTMGFSLVPAEITEFKDYTRAERVKIKVPADLYYDHAKKQIRTAYEYEYHTVQHYHGPFPIILTLITSMFLHGDLVHLIGNLWFLAIFGRNVECALDHGRFLAFYLACGICGGLAHVFSDMHSLIPCLGASGAISGIMGAYVSIHPFNKIRLWFGWWLGVIELPAIAVVGFWFLFQYLSAFLEMESGVSDGVAYWDHIGGFLGGVVMIWGTIFYLKWQLANQPQTPADDPASSADPAAAPGALAATAVPGQPDPFGNFLPATATPATPVEADAEEVIEVAPLAPEPKDPFESLFAGSEKGFVEKKVNHLP
jgi:membrane associated rhomboid family serine protease